MSQEPPPPPIGQPACPATWRDGYAAALIATAIAVPLLGAVGTVLFYCIHKGSWAALVGAAITLIGWFGFAFWYRHYTTPDRANPTVYNQLVESLTGLELKCRQIKPPPTDDQDKTVLYRDFTTRICAIKRRLCCEKGDLRWVSATGYLSLWEIIHQLDEDLIKFDSPQLAHEDVQFDRLRLSDSTIPDHQAMLDKLDAVTKVVQTALDNAAPGNDPKIPEPTLLDLVTVRKTISDFRDSQRIGLAEARNRLIIVGIITGLTLDALVGLAVAYGVDRRRLATAGAFFLAGGVIGIFRRLYDEAQSSSDVEDYSLSTARTIVVPMLSGIAGLFGVLFILIPGALNGSLPIVIPAPTNPPASVTVTATTPGAAIGTLATTTANAGASTALTATPRASVTGTATTAVPTIAPTPVPSNLPARTATLDDLFDIERYPLVLIVAAIFGFAPSLFVNKLQQQAEEYKQGLKRSA